MARALTSRGGTRWSSAASRTPTRAIVAPGTGCTAGAFALPAEYGARAAAVPAR